MLMNFLSLNTRNSTLYVSDGVGVISILQKSSKKFILSQVIFLQILTQIFFWGYRWILKKNASE